MKKLLLLLNLLILFSIVQAQTLMSPSEYLGYNIGDRFTPHYKINEYCHYLFQQKQQSCLLYK